MTTPGRTPRVRRPRTVVASLAAIVLAVEVLVVFLAALVLFGQRTLPPAVALGGGGALLVLILIAAALSRKRVGIALGWIVQAVLVVTIAVDVAVGIVGILFAALWVYCIIMGTRIDRRTA